MEQSRSNGRELLALIEVPWWGPTKTMGTWGFNRETWGKWMNTLDLSCKGKLL